MIAYLEIGSMAQLTAILREHNTPIGGWGQGHRGTVKGLFDQIASGKTKLGIEDGRLKIETSYVLVALYHPTMPKGTWHILIETRKEMPNGSTRRFDRLMGLRKKIMDKETPLAAAERALREEVPLAKPYKICVLGSCPPEIDMMPRRYPGLIAVRKYKGIGALTLKPMYKRGHHKSPDADGVVTYSVWRPVLQHLVPQEVRDLLAQPA
jgi:hypothetical protein